MATLELQRPKRLSSNPPRRSPDLSNAPITPKSPTIIRTHDFILLPSVPTHEPEDNLPSPMALQQQFAMAAHNHAQAIRSRQCSSTDEANLPSSSPTNSCYPSTGSNASHDQDELEEIVDTEVDNSECDPVAQYDALRDVRNQQLEQLQSILNSIAEVHFDRTCTSAVPDTTITQILDDMFASLRLIAGHSAPLSPTFARSPTTLPGISQMSDADRLVLLVDRLKFALADVEHAHQASMLTHLSSLVHELFTTQRRLSRAALESPPRTPRSLAAPRRRSMLPPPSHHSPQPSYHRRLSRTSIGSSQSCTTVSTSSDEAISTASCDLLQQHKHMLDVAQTRKAALPTPPVAPHVPEQQHVDGSTFEMATVRQPSSAKAINFTLEAHYAHRPSALGLITPPSPRSDQASGAASFAERSDSTALPNHKRFSVQTDSAVSTTLPGYASDAAPGYDAMNHVCLDNKALGSHHVSAPDDLPHYNQNAAATVGGFATDAKKPIETPTLLERRRAKLAAQNSAYAARTREDLAMVESSIDRLSSVMPQLENQRALSPQEQRDAQLHNLIGRLAESSSKRMDNQRCDPPGRCASRSAPPPLSQITAPLSQITVPEQVSAVATPPAKAADQAALSESYVPKTPKTPITPITPITPVTPVSMHSASSSRRSSLIPNVFARKMSLTSLGKTLRRASIYEVKRKEDTSVTPHSVAECGPSGDMTARHCRATTHDSRAKSDIADGLTSLFNDGKPRKNSVGDLRSANRFALQTRFRAIDFSDDTPRGRDASLGHRTSVEEEEDSMLDDYTFASIDTTRSNHRSSIMSTDPPRSPASWSSGGASRISSRRSSQLTSDRSDRSDPATPTWPRSPLTPVSPVAFKHGFSGLHSKPSVTFAADHPQPPTPREQLLSPLRQCKSAASPFTLPFDVLDSVCASAIASAAAAAAATTTQNDLVVYSLFTTQSNNAADTSVRFNPAVLPRQSENIDLDYVDLDYFAEAQHTLGSLSVMLWCSKPTQIGGSIELAYELVDVDQGFSRTLYIGTVHDDIVLVCGSCESESESASKSESSGSGGERKRKQDAHHVSSARGVRMSLPARAKAQSGRVTLERSGAVARVKLIMSEAEQRAAALECRLENIVEFPLSAACLSSTRLGCAVCSKAAPKGEVVKGLLGSNEVVWKALPSEGWEELVDAWMCHADQELNASLTQTAVRFASRISDTSTPAERHQQMPTGWVGDTYLLVGRDMLNFDAVAFEKNLDDYKVSRTLNAPQKTIRTG